ncbi:MAG: ATP-binding protein [Chitinispirillia bacterium]|nr:ATP-binding protein [Chitinispirillia bacterium]MCL2267725.1 ATP-binding protein [Chitinispirillia bacterium]
MDELLIDAKLENLDAVLDFIAERLDAVQCPVKQQMRIAIVVEEVYVNIARYAYAFGTGPAVVRAAALANDLTIEFEDEGKPYNPLEREDPDITLPAEERKIGGLGIYMVKHMMDTVEYRRERNRNILTIRKKLV